MKLIIDGHHGVYVPKMFAEMIGDNYPNHLAVDVNILRQGPNHEWYWEAWDNILMEWKDEEGNTLWQSPEGDLFLLDPEEDPPEY